MWCRQQYDDTILFYVTSLPLMRLQKDEREREARARHRKLEKKEIKQ